MTAGPTSPTVDFYPVDGYTPPDGENVNFLIGDATFTGTLARTLANDGPAIAAHFSPQVRSGVLASALLGLGSDTDAHSDAYWAGTMHPTLAGASMQSSGTLIWTGTMHSTLAGGVMTASGSTFKELFFHARLRDDFSTIDGHSSVTWHGTMATTLGADSFAPGPSLVYDGMTASDGLVYEQTFSDNFSDAMTATDVTISDWISSILEKITASDTLLSQFNGAMNLTDSMTMSDMVKILFEVIQSEQMIGADSAASARVSIESLVDQLLATDAVSTRADALSVIALAMAMTDLLDTNPQVNLTESATMTATLTNVLTAYQLLLEVMTGTATTTTALIVTNSLVDSGLMTTSTITKLALTELLTELMTGEVSILFNGVEFQGWVVNTESRGATRYTEYPFNSMARVGSKYIGASDEGVFLLEGDDDAGNPIISSILTGKTDFGSPQMKNLAEAYIGHTSTGRIILKTIHTQAGVEQEDWYELKARVAGAHTEGRVSLGKGVKSLYWQFELVNPDGDDFDIDQMLFNVTKLSRRI